MKEHKGESELMKIAFLDKDGTLVKPKSGNTFVSSPDDQILLPNVEQRLNELVSLGYTLVVVSNQAGIEHGYKSLTSTVEEMKYLMQLLPMIDSCHLCADMKGEFSWVVDCFYGHFETTRYKGVYRKPETGMLKQAFLEKDIFLEHFTTSHLMIGDRPEDKQCAENAGIRFIDAQDWRDNGI